MQLDRHLLPVEPGSPHPQTLNPYNHAPTTAAHCTEATWDPIVCFANLICLAAGTARTACSSMVTCMACTALSQA